MTEPHRTDRRSRRGMTISVTLLGLTVCTVLLAYLVFGDSNDREALASLRLVGIVFRHGDRAPTELYPNDPHTAYEWPGGLGALSEKGSLQMHQLGANLRQRYYKLLPSDGVYSKANMFVLSSAAERCLMSAASFLAGFMPPLEVRNKLPVGWQPVAINSVPRMDDYLLAQKKPCAKYDDSLRRLYANGTAELQQLDKDNAELYAYLSKHSGLKINKIHQVEALYNTLDVEHSAGLQMPEWTETVFPEKMLPLAERNLALLTETPFMKKLKGGALLTEITDFMRNKRAHTLSPDRSLFVYSAHDVTLVNMMRALDIVEHTTGKPDYAAAIAMEAHSSSVFDDDYEIKIVYYFNSEDKFPKDIAIPGCKAPCSLSQFLVTIEKVTLRDYDEICKTF